jgi:hypothetical protein
LRRTDVVWRTLGRAAALCAFAPDARIAVVTTALPTKGTPNDAVLRAVVGTQLHALVDLGGHRAVEELRSLR